MVNAPSTERSALESEHLSWSPYSSSGAHRQVRAVGGPPRSPSVSADIRKYQRHSRCGAGILDFPRLWFVARMIQSEPQGKTTGRDIQRPVQVRVVLLARGKRRQLGVLLRAPHLVRAAAGPAAGAAREIASARQPNSSASKGRCLTGMRCPRVLTSAWPWGGPSAVLAVFRSCGRDQKLNLRG